MNILLTGGLGYIGSHTAVQLINDGHAVFLYDNLSNTKVSVLENISFITGETPYFCEGDIRDEELLASVLEKQKVDLVMHFAGLKSVNESVRNPLKYYENNVVGSLCLLSAMDKVGVKKLIFSSSASVYGEPLYKPIDEEHPLKPTNPYAQTKKHVEEIMADISRDDGVWQFVLLRYFNPVGAHSSGLIGENPKGIPNNLVPYIAKVASGELQELNVYGADYPTLDGTGVRDYIHIEDLAAGHIAAIDCFDEAFSSPAVFNLGTGRGASVIEMIKAYEQACSLTVRYKVVERRPGDVAECFAGVDKARSMLGWAANRSIDEMCQSSWAFQKNLKYNKYK